MKKIKSLLLIVLFVFCLALVGCSGGDDNGGESTGGTDYEKVKNISTQLMQDLENKQYTQISYNEKGVVIEYNSEGYFRTVTDTKPEKIYYVSDKDTIIATHEINRQSYLQYTYLTAEGAKEKFMQEVIRMISVDLFYFDVKDEKAIFELGRKLTNESALRCNDLLDHVISETGEWTVTINSFNAKTQSFSLSFVSAPFRDYSYSDTTVKYENYVFENGLLTTKHGGVKIESTNEVVNSWEYTLSTTCEYKTLNLNDYILDYHYIEGQE